ncbi:heme exporter protein CcmD [Motilimonas eburnea]|uniref:heme exporter protein CcmD n=1 Tax=Motilimonas eburnea TaxID=1737488 RepID=UPI001E646E57|nr:heme exporter protein CcmD [Motilimonas eburnea]MCE2571483.1 heme exporter protein CcmD [Motilimonas eburnea]
MEFTSLSDFLAMGGYGFYVWLAFGVSLTSLVWIIVDTRLTRRRILQQVRSNIERNKRIKAARSMENTL